MERKKKMKKHLKAVISLLLAFVLFASAIPAGTINAFAEGKLSSKVTYEADGTAVVTLEAGDFYNAVRYTTDGSVPTKKSKLYVMPIEITEKTLIRAAEFDGDKKVKGIKLTAAPKDSDSVSEKKESASDTSTANGKTGKITFKVTQLGNYKAIVELECETPDVEIRYTTDGSKPDEDSNLYENGIVIVENTKIRARAYKEGYKTTTTYNKTAPVKLFSDFDSEPVYNNDKDDDKKETVKEEEPEKESEKKPEKESTASEKKEIVIEKDKEESSVSEKISYKVTYMDTTSKSYVTLLKSKNSNVIRYTTDGSAVSKSSKKYSSRVAFTEPGVLRAKEYTKSGELVATLKISVKIKCAQVEFGCIGMDSGIRTITMSSKTPGATIYYTTDGSTPTEELGYVYESPLTLGERVDIKAIAVKDDYRRSNIAWEIVGRIELQLQDFDFSDSKYSEAANILNEYRKANGYKALTLDEGLTRAACIRAHEMAIYMDHVRPNGLNYTSVINGQGVDHKYSAELFAYNKDTAKQFIDSLTSDSDNQRYLLESGFEFKKVGIGYYKKGHAEYWVLLVTD